MWQKVKDVLIDLLAQGVGLLGLAVLFYFRRKVLGQPAALVATAKGNETMQTVTVTMEVPKESKEVVDCITAILKDVKAKKTVAEIAATALPKLVTAVDGFNAIGEEVKSQNKDELSGYLVQQTMDALGV